MNPECGKCPPCRRRRACRWIAHHSPWLIAAITVWRLLYPVELYSIDVLYWCAAPVIVLGVTHRPCPRCHAMTPLNARGAAARYVWALWVHHWWLHVYFGIMLSSLVFGLLPGSLVWLLDYLLAVVVYGAWIVVIRSRLRHCVLHRYCPYCNPPEREAEPVPEPVPVLPGPRS